MTELIVVLVSILTIIAIAFLIAVVFTKNVIELADKAATENEE